MENTRFLVSSSPHIRSGESTKKIMSDVVIALLPALFAGIWFFGLKALWLTMVAVGFAVATEVVMQKIMKRPVTVNDFSAVVTGILLTFNVPVTLPWWMLAIGAIFAIAIVKQCFGGVGYNFVNPALAARAMLFASWPVEMTSWVQPGVDAITTATPMAILKGTEATGVLPSVWNMFAGNIGGCIGETSALALLIGGLYLIYRKVISPRIPVVYIATVGILALLFGGFDMTIIPYHLFGGGLFLGAIFMATDYSSSPMTAKGQVIFAVGCGLITSIIRFYGGYPEGVSYSILLMNIATPLIDRFTLPRKFGGVKARA
ncbi:MAG: RnfABCDGE type electron transport complex subunit D [Lutisporaceae bacterium]